ncbi:Endothelial cell-selective adhesion molecule [Collichthys lucidus]|uniref:Endothelial cell-selective adhesion molecule n=1 Tax=Collichthys lucidus TaxID=240159 RepID=A0A4U5UZK7_COLLU|nr:Endothelial cell-selective adhesion molecule [Collichthys lucidus]
MTQVIKCKANLENVCAVVKAAFLGEVTMCRVIPAELSRDTQKVEIPRGEMEVVKGQVVVLHAWYSPNSDISKNSVIWNFVGTSRSSSGEVGHGQNDFTKRVGFSATMPSANLSIYINNTQESDSGRYICTVIIRGSAGITGDVRLNVKGNGPQHQSHFKSVLHDREPDGEGQRDSELQIKLWKTSPSVQMDQGCTCIRGLLLSRCRVSVCNSDTLVRSSKMQKYIPYVSNRSKHARYKLDVWSMQSGHRHDDRLLIDSSHNIPSHERHGTLRLSNLTKSMSGKYICRASNTAGSDSCSINLEVITSSNAGMVAAATLGSIVGLVAMVLFLIFILRRRQDTEEEEIANEIKEDAQAPKRVSWAKSNTGSDVGSKNGTLSSIATSPRPQDPHQLKFHYPYSPTSASDSSVINAYHLRPGEGNTLQGLPGYNIGGTPSRKHKRPPSANGGPPQVLRSPCGGHPQQDCGGSASGATSTHCVPANERLHSDTHGSCRSHGACSKPSRLTGVAGRSVSAGE